MVITRKRTKMHPGIQAAHAARATQLGGLSPRARGEAKVAEALDWIYRWGWASPQTIDGLSGAKRRGLSARLVRRGLLVATRTQAGGAGHGVPAQILTLSTTGQAEVERYRNDLLPYSRDPYKIRQDQLRHYELAQRATANSLLSGSIAGFRTEVETAQRSVAGQKQPDVEWLFESGRRAGVEVELTAKWARDLDQFVLACLRGLTSSAEKPARFDLIILLTDSPAIRRRYLQAFEPGRSFNRWQKNDRGHWETSGTSTVPSWATEKVLCKLVD